MRCFIGIDLSSSAIKEIKKLQNIIEPHFTGKITESKNLHLTLKFLGEINNDTLKKVKKKLSIIKSQSLKLYLDKLGVFSKKFVKIVWVKISNVSLQKLIDNSLADIFEKEWRFMGHITIARIKNLKNKLENLENVHDVITLIDLPLLKTANVPLKRLSEDKIKRITDPNIDINLAKKEILESPIFKNLIVSEDGQLTSLIVNLKRDEQFINLLKKRNDLRAKEKLKIDREKFIQEIKMKSG